MNITVMESVQHLVMKVSNITVMKVTLVMNNINESDSGYEITVMEVWL